MNYSFPEEVSRIPVEQVVMKKLRNSMLWMAWGVLTTFVTILGALFNPQWLAMASHNYTWILLIELGVVILFSARQLTASVTSLKAMFFIYSILTGLTLAVVRIMVRRLSFMPSLERLPFSVLLQWLVP